MHVYVVMMLYVLCFMCLFIRSCQKTIKDICFKKACLSTYLSRHIFLADRKSSHRVNLF